jgi:tyrosyl-tRNA synthetase
VAEIITEEELVRLLDSGRPLRLKQGFDPSRPDIHLGHLVGLRKLHQFQERGHRIVLIIGDWTAQIGDPSGESVTRPMLTAREVQENAQTYLKQFFKIVDRDRTEVRWQSEWYGRFSLADVISLTSKFTVAQLLAREDFSKRMAAGRPIALTELLYPLLQAYDSVVIEADVEFGGIDQKFNCLVGRELQVAGGQTAQQLLLVPLLVGTDGHQKMSKSLGNYVGIEEPPKETYGKLMSIPDSLLIDYFELLTDTTDEELEGIRNQLAGGKTNPMLLKKRLARMLVTQLHSAEAAEEAEGYFTRVFQERREPEEFPLQHVLKEILNISGMLVGINEVGAEEKGYIVNVPLLLTIIGFAKSKGEAKRLIAQGAVEVDRKTIADLRCEIRGGTRIRVGNRRFAELVERKRR